ncbi:MAG TPA: DUF397 domain-containing protein [Pseudonocardiaceae bacterium]|jgi:hypothetical protein|nr:DUF397 domain-containing protein [Pseudonocardiaceae bacterium]
MTYGSVNADALIGARWRKGSHSNNAAGCVEVAMIDAEALAHASWRKSSRSDNQVNCVEVAMIEPVTGVRDSKHPHGPALLFPNTAFDGFLTSIQRAD